MFGKKLVQTIKHAYTPMVANFTSDTQTPWKPIIEFGEKFIININIKNENRARPQVEIIRKLVSSMSSKHFCCNLKQIDHPHQNDSEPIFSPLAFANKKKICFFLIIAKCSKILGGIFLKHIQSLPRNHLTTPHYRFINAQEYTYFVFSSILLT